MPTVLCRLADLGLVLGLIFGERIERFESSDDVNTLLNHPLDVPCTFAREDGTRWRTEQEESFELGDGSRVYQR